MNYKDGRKTATHYCIEPGCNNTISYSNWLNGGKRCRSCKQKGVTPWNKDKKGLQVGWSKGLTKETDSRVKKLSHSSWNKNLTKETEDRLVKQGRAISATKKVS